MSHYVSSDRLDYKLSYENKSKGESAEGVSVLFPGWGDPDRVDLMKKHVQWLRSQDVPFDCTILVYKSEESFPVDPLEFEPCSIIRHVGLYGEHVKAFQPNIERPWVLTWIDSVDIAPEASLARMIRIAEVNQLDHLGVGEGSFSGEDTPTSNQAIGTYIFEPELHEFGIDYDDDGKAMKVYGQAQEKGIPVGSRILRVNGTKWNKSREVLDIAGTSNYNYSVTFQVGNLSDVGVGREYHGLDFQFDLFRKNAFKCLQSVHDVDINPSGWGADLVFQWACNVRQGIWDEVPWSHASRASYSYKSATSEMFNFFAKYNELGWSYVARCPIRQLHDPSNVCIDDSICGESSKDHEVLLELGGTHDFAEGTIADADYVEHGLTFTTGKSVQAAVSIRTDCKGYVRADAEREQYWLLTAGSRTWHAGAAVSAVRSVMVKLDNVIPSSLAQSRDLQR